MNPNRDCSAFHQWNLPNQPGTLTFSQGYIYWVYLKAGKSWFPKYSSVSHKQKCDSNHIPFLSLQTFLPYWPFSQPETMLHYFYHISNQINKSTYKKYALPWPQILLQMLHYFSLLLNSQIPEKVLTDCVYSLTPPSVTGACPQGCPLKFLTRGSPRASPREIQLSLGLSLSAAKPSLKSLYLNSYLSSRSIPFKGPPWLLLPVTS